MRKIYLDAEFRCHAANDGTMTEIETDFVDGKCTVFVEGYRFVPAGKTWIREDGVIFTGEMVAPWRPYKELAAAQAQFEADQAELAAAYREGVNSV